MYSSQIWMSSHSYSSVNMALEMSRGSKVSADLKTAKQYTDAETVA